MELSWDQARSHLSRLKEALPRVLSNGEILANIIGNSSDME
jgi:hypothetical protein